MAKTDFTAPAWSWNGTGMWPVSPSSGDSPSTASVSWSMKECRRSSPSVTTSRPTPSCMAIAWSTARSSTSLYAAAGSWPASYCSRASFRYCGRSSDPTMSARYTSAMSGPSFAFRTSRPFVSPAQQRLERLPERLFGCARRIDGTPSHEAVRPHDHGTRRRDPVRLEETAPGVGQAGATHHVGIERYGEPVRGGERRCLPGAALGPGEQNKVPAEEIERGQPCAVAGEEDVRRSSTRPAVRLTWMFVQRMAAWFEHHGGRVVAVPDLHG